MERTTNIIYLYRIVADVTTFTLRNGDVVYPLTKGLSEFLLRKIDILYPVLSLLLFLMVRKSRISFAPTTSTALVCSLSFSFTSHNLSQSNASSGTTLRRHGTPLAVLLFYFPVLPNVIAPTLLILLCNLLLLLALLQISCMFSGLFLLFF